MTTSEPESSNQLAEDRTRLATERTIMAADRSLMAWVRTALSMISFGFTIYKLLIGFQESGTELPHQYNAREIGLFLIGLGTAAMVAGTIEYWFRVREIYNHKRLKLRKKPSFIISALISVVGVVLFFGIIINIL